MRIVRGATFVKENSKEEIEREATHLFETILKRNGILKDDILGIIFTMTKDLTKSFPSTSVRKKFGLKDTPLLDLEQKFVEDSYGKCIRVMMFVNTDRRLKPVYMNGAEILREDLSGGEE